MANREILFIENERRKGKAETTEPMKTLGNRLRILSDRGTGPIDSTQPSDHPPRGSVIGLGGTFGARSSSEYGLRRGHEKKGTRASRDLGRVGGARTVALAARTVVVTPGSFCIKLP